MASYFCMICGARGTDASNVFGCLGNLLNMHQYVPESLRSLTYPDKCVTCGLETTVSPGMAIPSCHIVAGKSIEHSFVPNMVNISEKRAVEEFVVKDSGKRQTFQSGMVRDTQDGKADFTRILDGPMFDRWAAHLTKGGAKYPDVKPGVPNWTLASGEEELARFKKSAFRHFRQWMRGDIDEDHASAVFFNINGAEFVKEKLLNERPSIEPK